MNWMECLPFVPFYRIFQRVSTLIKWNWIYRDHESECKLKLGENLLKILPRSWYKGKIKYLFVFGYICTYRVYQTIHLWFYVKWKEKKNPLWKKNPANANLTKLIEFWSEFFENLKLKNLFFDFSPVTLLRAINSPEALIVIGRLTFVGNNFTRYKPLPWQTTCTLKAFNRLV